MRKEEEKKMIETIELMEEDMDLLEAEMIIRRDLWRKARQDSPFSLYENFV
jgi:hypothetical protein